MRRAAPRLSRHACFFFLAFVKALKKTLRVRGAGGPGPRIHPCCESARRSNQVVRRTARSPPAAGAVARLPSRAIARLAAAWSVIAYLDASHCLSGCIALLSWMHRNVVAGWLGGHTCAVRRLRHSNTSSHERARLANRVVLIAHQKMFPTGAPQHNSSQVWGSAAAVALGLRLRAATPTTVFPTCHRWPSRLTTRRSARAPSKAFRRACSGSWSTHSWAILVPRVPRHPLYKYYASTL